MSESKMNWDLKSYFPEFNGAEMKEFKKILVSDLNAILDLAKSLKDISPENLENWEKVFMSGEELSKKYSHLRSYVGCLSAADGNNEEYLKEEADMIVLGSRFEKLGVEILGKLAVADPNTIERLKALECLKTSSYYIDRLFEESRKRMSDEKEVLASDLAVNGIRSWGRLYDTVSGKLMFDMEYPNGEVKKLPMSQRRSLMDDPDRDIRKQAFYGGNKTWKEVEEVAASCLNAISGTRLTLNFHRGINHFLDVALFQSSVSRETLDAMFEAIYDEIEVPKNILRYKAELIGEKAISWYDLGAPLEIRDRQAVDWESAKSMILESFTGAYPKLGEFFLNLCNDNWVDWEPREGKRPGGFCTGSMLTNESRIFMTYNQSLGDVLTLAHEAGHAFHSFIMKDLRPYQKYYPMTLAETASTFAEMILERGILSNVDISDTEKALMLDTEINHGAIYLMDIPVRYEFEKSLYEERNEGVLSVSRLKELMVDTQRNVFGDVLHEADPYFWASKLHFYITSVTFYNFPYTFGYLLSRALFYRFANDGEDFLKRYENFLEISGSFDCEEVVQRSIGEDITDKRFWSESIKTLEEPLKKLKELVPKIDLQQTQ